MSKHTPGPWSFQRHDPEFPNFGHIEGTDSKDAKYIRSVALILKYTEDQECLANANLIAAAPAMRELLTELRDELHDHNDGTPNTEWIMHYVWRINDLLKGGKNDAD